MAVDSFYVVYFLLHFLITILIDSTIVIPKQFLLPIQRYLSELHIRSNHDLLVANPPPWLQAFVWIEIVFQTPFFLVAAYALAKGSKRIYPACLVYGVEACITTIACLVEVACLNQLTQGERLNLVLVYLPTAVIPLGIAMDFYLRLVKSSAKPKTD